MTDFQKFKTYFDTDKMDILTSGREGLLWLKLKSISRKELLEKFCQNFSIEIVSKKTGEIFSLLFDELLKDIEKSHLYLDKFIRDNSNILNETQEKFLVSQLYQLKHFDWGGDYKNALDKFLVDKYIKTTASFDEINSKLEIEIPKAVYGYVLCSWYNHWTTILIENIFKKHQKITPAIGKVKKVDFFIEDIPFDLKVTYVPMNFIEKLRKENGLRSELSELKSIAKKYSINFHSESRGKDIAYEISEKIKDTGDVECLRCLAEIKDFREKVINSCISNPRPLIQNFYEEQGEMRFDASNRLFVVLIDRENFEESWKLKRNISLLTSGINNYLDNFSKSIINNLKLEFTHKAKAGLFSAISDVIFIVR